MKIFCPSIESPGIEEVYKGIVKWIHNQSRGLIQAMWSRYMTGLQIRFRLCERIL